MVGLQVQGGGDEESEDRSKKRKIVAPAAESTNTGTEITTPFGDENDAKAMGDASVPTENERGTEIHSYCCFLINFRDDD